MPNDRGGRVSFACDARDNDGTSAAGFDIASNWWWSSCKTVARATPMYRVKWEYTPIIS